jgi:hypothetical protein
VQGARAAVAVTGNLPSGRLQSSTPPRDPKRLLPA